MPRLPRRPLRSRVAAAITSACLALTAAVAHAQAPNAAIEFYNASLDHYFVSPLAADIEALDSGRFAGWTRTGRSFGAWPDAASAPTGVNASPVCRFYIPPQKGDSHFFSASPAECADVERKVATDPAYAGFVYETPAAFFVGLPDAVSGACAAGTAPVYRLWNQRADSNHRYTTDPALRNDMRAKGWIAEGYGPDAVAMCAPPSPDVETIRVSADTPFPAGCSVATGGLYTNAEVEPHLAVNPRDPQHLIGAWQQDRWSNGGARGLVTGVSFDGGRTWERRAVPFTRCAGGNAGNGGDFDRASDPWVTFGPDGVAWQSSLSFTGGTLADGSRSAIVVSRSADGGRTWSDPRTLIVDGSEFFNDKEAITADPADARLVYVAWDRLRRTGGGPSTFARTTDGGASWEAARAIHDPGTSSQTINNIPVVTGDGTLAVFFTRLDVVDGRTVPTLQIVRSPDKGATWGTPVTIAPLQSVGTRDPENGTAVRDAAILGSIAAGPGNQLAVVWQDARFSDGTRDGIALSRSFDGGSTWTTPVQVNRDPSVPAFVPTVAIRNDGTIAVTYFDFRSNTADPAMLQTEVWLAQSADGATWRERRVAGPFDLATAPVANGLFVGDYMALAARSNDFVTLFARTNNADTRNRTDVHVAVVAEAAVAAGQAKRMESGEALPDPAGYRAGPPKGPLDPDAELAARIDAAAKAVMQRRVPGWRSPAEPLGPVRATR